MVRQGKFLIVILLFLFGTIVFGQDKKNDAEKDKKLRDEILDVYKSKGEEGLRDFVKNQIDRIGNKFIVDFAESGVKKRNEEWLKVCKILAKEKKYEKTLADVYFNVGEYSRLISDNKKAIDYFDIALSIYIKLDKPIGQGNVYFLKGTIFFFSGDNVGALEMFNKSLTFLKKGGYLLGQGNVYNKMGELYHYTGDNYKALKMYEKALIILKKTGSLRGQGNVYNAKGLLYAGIGDNSNALAMYEKAISFFEKARDILGLGNVYWCKGNTYLYTGNNISALEMYKKAMFFYEEAKSIVGQANVYWRKGDIYRYNGYNKKALRSYDKALHFFEKAGDPLGQGNMYNSMGDIYFHIGENSKSLKMCDRALYFFKKTGDLLGKGNVYMLKGDIYLQIGYYSKSIEMYNKALPFFEILGEPHGQGNINRKKGDIYFRTGGYVKSLDMCDKALLFYEKAEDPLGQGNVYFYKGLIYLNSGDYSKSFEMCAKALPFFKKVGDNQGQGNVYNNMGDIYLNIGDNSRALEMYDKSLSFYKKSGEPGGIGDIYNRKGDICFHNGDNSKALDMYNQALMLYGKVGILNKEAYTLYKKAKSLAKLGEKNHALAFFENAIFKIEKIRSQTAFSEMKRTFMEKIYYQYWETAVFMLNNKYYDKGFKYVESMKTRVFLDQLAEGLLELEKGITSNLKQMRDDLVSKLSFLSKEINQAAGKKDEKKMQDLKVKYRKVESDFEDALVKIRLDNPLYASIKYPEPIPIKKLRKKVLKKGELLLRYFVSSEKVYVFLVSKRDFKVISLEVHKNEVNRIVNRHLLSIKANDKEKSIKYGKDLYQSLFKPVETSLKGKKNIIIVPDGQMAAIPFESFVIGENEASKTVYLLEKYQIKYIQSASVLATMRKHYQRKGKTQHFIGFGDPVYDYENYKKGLPEKGSPDPGKGDEIKEIYRGKYDREGGLLDRLQGSGQEVEAIAGLFKKQNQKCVVHLREQANEENAKSLYLKEFDYIHFSCHGVLGEGFQSLVLSQLPEAKEDGYLTLNEIMNCDYNAKLVVLSACKTGSGKMYRGEGVTGLTRAVMYAGTPAVVASLWNVQDIATKELMVQFYKNMLEKGMKKEKALRKAKLEMIKSEKYSSPYYWSAFVMYGE